MEKSLLPSVLHHYIVTNNSDSAPSYRPESINQTKQKNLLKMNLNFEKLLLFV